MELFWKKVNRLQRIRELVPSVASRTNGKQLNGMEAVKRGWVNILKVIKSLKKWQIIITRLPG